MKTRTQPIGTAVIFALLLAFLTFFWACNESFQVLKVSMKTPTWVTPSDYTYKVALTIEFNHQVDITKFSAPGTVRIDLKGTRDGRTALNVAGIFKQSPDLKTVVFISDKSLSDLIKPGAGENIEYTLIISGTTAGIGAVTDKNGQILDGDADGKPGGDYKKVFEVVG